MGCLTLPNVMQEAAGCHNSSTLKKEVNKMTAKVRTQTEANTEHITSIFNRIGEILERLSKIENEQQIQQTEIGDLQN